MIQLQLVPELDRASRLKAIRIDYFDVAKTWPDKSGDSCF